MILDALPVGAFEVKVYNNLDLPGIITANKILIKETKILNDFQYYLGAVTPETKRKLTELFKLPYQILINPSAFVSRNSTIHAGTMIDSNASIASGVTLGKYVTVYANSSIAHDSVLEDYVTLCPNVTICGDVTIGEGTFIGAGTTIKNKITIGKNCVIGSGSNVINDIPDGVTIFGNPAQTHL